MAKVLPAAGVLPSTMGHQHHLHTQLTKSLERILEEAHLSGELKLSGRKLKDFPKTGSKYDLTDTVIADLSKNKFWELPTEVLELLYVEKLQLYHNALRSLPDSMGCLQSLRFLDLSRNQLTALPAGLCHLQSLEVLLVANNKLCGLPDDIGNLKNLMELDASCNEMGHLPRSMGRLKNLKALHLRKNLLIELPLELTYLKLTLLDMSENRLSTLPIELRQMGSLETLRLDGNPLVSPPAILAARGRVHIFKFLDNLAGKTDSRRTLRKTAVPDLRTKRHTVDSGYSTSDGADLKWTGEEGRTKTKPVPSETNIPATNGGDESGESSSPGDELSRSTLVLDQMEAKRLISLQNNDRCPVVKPMVNGNGTVSSEERRSFEHIQTYREYKEALRQQRAQPQDVYRPRTDGTSTPISPVSENPDAPKNGHVNGEPLSYVKPDVNGEPLSYVKPASPVTKGGVTRPRQPSPRPVKWTADLPPDKLSFTMRREFERAKEEAELMDQLRHNIESRLRMSLPSDLGPALMDGVVLCHLANHVRPRSVASIHVPSPAVPKLSMARCRRNVDNFLDACRKIGLEEAELFGVGDVVASLDAAAVLRTVARLLDMTAPPPLNASVTSYASSVASVTSFAPASSVASMTSSASVTSFALASSVAPMTSSASSVASVTSLAPSRGPSSACLLLILFGSWVILFFLPHEE